MDNKLLSIKSFKTIYSALLTKVEGLINKSNSMLTDKIDGLADNIEGLDFKSDWNQNDENAKDYIKNRPFGEEDRTAFYLNETTINGFAESGDLYRVLFDEYISLNQPVLIGETYTILWDGEEYNATLYSEDGGNYFGINYYSPNHYNPDNLPFGIWLNYEWNSEANKGCSTQIQLIFTDSSTSASHTIAIHKDNIVIKKIDKKYLPDFVIKSEVVTVTRKADDWERATYSAQDIYDLHKAGKSVVFVEGDMTYYLTYSEVDPATESTFISIWQNYMYTIKVSGSGWIATDILDVGSIEDANFKINDIELNIDLKMDKANPVGTGSFSMNRKPDSRVGNYSAVFGNNIEATGRSSFVCGEHNKEMPIYKDNYLEYTSHTARYLKSGNYYYSKEFTFDENTGIYTLVNPSVRSVSSTQTLAVVGEGNYFVVNSDNDIIPNEAISGNKLCGIIKDRDNGYGQKYSTTFGNHNTNYYKMTSISQHYPSTPTANERGAYAHIVGNGISNTACSNAHTLDWNGNAWFAGDVYVGSTSGTNKDEGSKKLATEEYTDIAVANLINSAPETLDTLGELATAFEENEEVVSALNDAIATKANKTALEALSALVGDEPVAEQIDEVVSVKQDKNLIVNITHTTADDGTKTYSADKTFAEVNEAITSGVDVVLYYSQMYFTLSMYSGVSAIFTSSQAVTGCIMSTITWNGNSGKIAYKTANAQTIADRKTTLSADSTHGSYPSAKAVVDYVDEAIGNINLDTYEFITVADIDEICDSTIATASEVTL